MLKKIDFVAVTLSILLAVGVLQFLLKGPASIEFPKCEFNTKEFQCASNAVTISDQVSCLKKQQKALGILSQCVTKQEVFIRKYAR